MKKVACLFAILFALIMLVPRLNVSADEDERVRDTDTSFAEEGGEAYERLKDKVWNNPDETLNQLLDDAKDTGDSIVSGDPVKKIWVYFFHVYDEVSSFYPAILIVCMVVGIGGAVLSSKNKKIRKRIVIVSCVAIPLLATLFVYVLPYLYLRLS